MADADPLFTLDVVREFIVSQGGKVSNHTLVSHFKSFLNDSKRKEANRQKFKEYVNVLSTVKLDTSGEKLLVLKKKFRDSGSFTGFDLAKPAAPVAANSKHDKPLDGAKYAKMRQKQRAEKGKQLDQTAKCSSEGDLTKSAEDEKENRQQAASCENLLDVGTDKSVPEGVSEPAKEREVSSETEISDDRHQAEVTDSVFVSPSKTENMLIDSEVSVAENVSNVPVTSAEDANENVNNITEMDLEVVHTDSTTKTIDDSQRGKLLHLL